MPFRVVIVGAGLAGSLLGNGLLHHDVDFTVYEADPRGSRREGYQIRLGAPALVGFRSCLTQEQQQRLYPLFGRSGGVVSSAPILYDTHLNTLLDLTKFPAYTKSAPINRVILRDFLQEPLHEAGRIRYATKFKSFTIVEKPGKGRRVRVEFEDGSTDECHLLISAEGTRSAINAQVGLNNLVQLKQRWGFLAKGNLPPSTLLGLAPEVRKSPITVIQDGIILFFSAYLPDGIRNTQNRGNKTQQELDYDSDIASLFWSLSVPTDRLPENPQNISNKLEFCIELIQSWDTRFHDMLRAIGNNEGIHVFQAKVSTEPPKDWRRKMQKNDAPELGNNHVWLIGDAMHAMLPARGMGGNQSMNDCADAIPVILSLASKANNESPTEDDFETAVKQFEGKMGPRAFHWVKTSGGTGREMIEPSSLKGKVMLFFMAKALQVAYIYTLVRRLFGFVPRDDAPELPD